MKRFGAEDVLLSEAPPLVLNDTTRRLRWDMVPDPPAGDVLSAGRDLGARVSPPAGRDWELLLDLVACVGAPAGDGHGDAPRTTRGGRIGEAGLLLLAGVAGGAIWSVLFILCWNVTR